MSAPLPILRQTMPELDALRGLAIGAVLLYHGFYWQVDTAGYPPLQRWFVTAMWAGRMGVTLFFVLSGFLITGILLNSRRNADYYRRFYVRRALRILPAYLLTLGLLALAAKATPGFLLLSAFYLSNLAPLFGVPISYPVLWSLAVEEQFYLVWPVFIRNLSDKVVTIVASGCVILAPLTRLLSFNIASKSGYISYKFNDYTWNALDSLACGALIVVAIRHWPNDRVRLRWVALLSLSGGVLVWLAALPFGILNRKTPVGSALQPTPWNFMFVGLLCLFLLVGTSGLKSLVTVRFLRFLGEISYGLYLVHFAMFGGFDRLFPAFRAPAGRVHVSFFMLGVRFVSVVVVSVLVAYVSRWWFEEPFLKLKNRWSPALETTSIGPRPSGTGGPTAGTSAP